MTCTASAAPVITRIGFFTDALGPNATFEVPAGHDGELRVALELPSPTGIYDDFRLTLDGAPTPFARDGSSRVEATLPSPTAVSHTLSVGYVSQGLDRFSYRFGDGVTQVSQFRLTAVTDFTGFDFPDGTMSGHSLRMP